MLELIIEEATKSIHPRIQEKLKCPVVREWMFETYGEEAFLDPSNKKYPVVNPETGKYRSDLIFAGYVRSRMDNHNESVEKAVKLFEEKGCHTELTIKIQEIDQSVIDITELMFTSELDKETLTWIG